MPAHRIVLGVDGSPGAQAAVRWCASYAGLFGAHVHAIHVVAPALAGTLPPLDVAGVTTDEELARLTEALEDWCEPMRDAPVSYEARVVQGAAAGTLMQLADEVDALMVVVGRRGERNVAELFLGSVPRTLTHECTRPVLVVPG
jgi:nucleotide-binding universal stress UspA family protein